MCGVALAFLAALSLAAATDAGAASFTPKTTPELETAIETANANAEENTIHLEANTTYTPGKTLTLTNATHPQFIEGAAGPSAVHGPAVSGQAVEPETSELLVVGAGVTATFKWFDLSQGGGLGNPGIVISENAHLSLEETGVDGMNGNSLVVHPGATLTAVNTTIAKATTGDGVVDDGTANLTNSTVALNEEGGIQNEGALSLTNTIVAENNITGGFHDCTGRVANTSDHSLDSDGTCGVGTLSSMNPKLKTAPNYDGGPTRLESLTPGSPAINAGDETKCPTIDQRGYRRPDVSATACDVGADEYNEVKPVITASTVPVGLTIPANSSSGAPAKFTPPSATTTGEAAVESVTCTPETATEFPVGTTTVSCVAKDGHENESAPATFKVSVMKPEGGVASATASGLPAGVAVNSEGDVWVSEWETNAVKEFSATGTFIRNVTIASPCTGALNGPYGVAIDSLGNLWVTDSNNDRVLEFNSAGTCLRQFGSTGRENGQFEYPTGIAIGPGNNVWVTDTFNERVQEFSETGTFIKTLGGAFGSGPGQFEVPEGIAVDSSGHLWVSDMFGNHVDELSETGELLGRINAQLPSGVAADASGNVWFAELDTGVIHQYTAGRVLLGSIGSSGSKENQDEWPHGLAVDSTRGNLWIPDEGNQRVDKWIGADPPSPPAPAGVVLKKKARTTIIH
jgi:sugar lactone lactonase YvrE